MESLTIPIEVMEFIFVKLDPKSLKTCRLVCRTWNSEIKSHSQLKVIVNDDYKQNLEFVAQVKKPITLKLTKLKTQQYFKCFTVHSLRRVQELDISFPELVGEAKPVPVQKFDFQFFCDSSIINLTRFKLNVSALDVQTPPASQMQKFNLQFFGDFCMNLSILKFNVGVLARFDLVNDSFLDTSTTRIWPLYNLNQLFINGVQDYTTKCSGLEVQTISKNIWTLLSTIKSQQLKTLQVAINATNKQINNCIGREQYRFEGLLLDEFISKHSKTLEVLDISIPVFLSPMPPHDSFEKYLDNTTQLKSFRVESPYNAPEFSVQCRVTYPELLAPAQNFRMGDEDDDNGLFWSVILMGQTKAELLLIKCNRFVRAHPNPNVVSGILSRNQKSLQDFTFEAYIPSGIMDLENLQANNCPLTSLTLTNLAHFGDKIIGTWMTEEELDDHWDNMLCTVINVRNLPSHLQKLNLWNVYMSDTEILFVLELSLLKEFTFMFDAKQSKFQDLGKYKNVDGIIKRFMMKRSLDKLCIGPFVAVEKSKKPIFDLLLKLFRHEKLNICIGPMNVE